MISAESVVFPRSDNYPQFWKSWEGKMYEFVGRDKNKDPIMCPLDEADLWKCISGRALNRTWHPKWKSLCCDRWLNYEPDSMTTCFHSG